MAIINQRNFQLRQFMEFADGSPPFDLIDICNDAEAQDERSFTERSGAFVYKTELVVNDRKAAFLGIEGIRFEIYQSDPKRYGTSTRTVVQTFEVPFETAARTSVKVAGNTKQQEIRADVQRGSVLNVFAQVGSPIRLDKLSVPNTATARTTTLQRESNVALENNFDPALLAAVGNFATQTAESAASLDSTSAASRSTGAVNVGNELRTQISLASVRSATAAAIRGRQNNPIARLADTPNTTSSQSQTAAFQLLPTNRLVKRNFYINKDALRGLTRFYVRVTAIQAGQGTLAGLGRPIQVSEQLFAVNHRKQLSQFLANPEPPEVEIVASRLASVTFRLTRNDPTLQRVNVTSIVTNPYAVRPETKTITKLEFGSNNVLTFTTAVNNVKPNKVIFRFSVINDDNSVGEFTSVVIPSKKKVSDPRNTASTPLSIYARNRGVEGVEVTVKPLTSDVLTLRLLRQELGKTGDFSDTIVNVRNQDDEYETVIKNTTPVTFIDKTAVLGRKYRYFAAHRIGKFRGGPGLSEETMSDEDEIIIRRYPIQRLPFTVNVNNVTTTNDASGLPAVTFNTTSIAQVELFNTVVASLREAGVGEEFIANLQAEKVKAKNFVMLLVERYEVETGRRVSFGLRAIGDFTDDQASRRRLGLPAPFPGFSYVYTFKVCLQDPAVFLQTTDADLVTRLGSVISKKASRFSRKIFTRLGVLPAETDVRNGISIEQLILESQVGIEIRRNVTIPVRFPKIENLSVRQRSFATTISWETNGDIRDVSYFNVFCTIDGRKNLLGAVAVSRDSERYTFRDRRYYRAVGTKAYSVEAISFNHDVYMKSAVKKSTQQFSVPDNLIVGAVFGSFGSKRTVLPISPNRSSHENLIPSLPDAPEGNGNFAQLANVFAPPSTTQLNFTGPPLVAQNTINAEAAFAYQVGPAFGAAIQTPAITPSYAAVAAFASPASNTSLTNASANAANVAANYTGATAIDFANTIVDVANEIVTNAQQETFSTPPPQNNAAATQAATGYGSSNTSAAATGINASMASFMF